MISDNKQFKTIGIMSGTSLDGVDVVACNFWKEQDNWRFEIERAHTYPYAETMYARLADAQNLSGRELALLDVDYGKYLGENVLQFLSDFDYQAHFVASHGYTVFHEPQNGFTLQIGSGADIAAVTGIKTICNFRTTDVAYGGQGAPLVPIGDKLLFSNYDACLNLGGFANISFTDNSKKRMAFDICPVNYVFNHLAKKLGADYDKNGNWGQQGKVNDALLNQLNNLSFYSQKPPKSLGREFVETQVLPLFSTELNIKDLLATCYKHAAIQIGNILNSIPGKKVLITGGGVKNRFLIELISQLTPYEIVIPDAEIIDFKEALIFAFLGVLRLNNESNCLASVTGAKKDNCGGAVFLT